MTEELPWIIKVELIVEPSINATAGVLVIIALEPCWMDPIIDFLVENFPEFQMIRRRSVGYARLLLSTGYRQTVNYTRGLLRGPYLLYLHPEKVNELLIDLHEKVCSGHVGGRSLTHRAMTQRFWWPQKQKDVAEYVWKCEQCQKHFPLIHQPVSYLNLVSSP